MSEGALGAQERYIVMGTAGHIDHGKTTLVKALTGHDCDTLEEEKRRGITINLGFASFRLDEETQVGVVDMPGHHRFIRNMVAGAVGIDFVLLVVAADDGVMPQTVEHLQIARLLGVKRGLVALTKADIVEPEILELAKEDVRSLIAPTFLKDSPIVPVSSITGQGIDELKEEIQKITAGMGRSGENEPFRMHIDRSFSVKGVGTVVTGTTHSGRINVDDELELLPSGKKVRVRGLQVHGEDVKGTGPGHRAAVNIVGADKDEVARGDVLISPGSMLMTHMLDAEIELLAANFAPLRRGSEAALHIGTTELSAKTHPLEIDQLGAGSAGMVQLRFAEPVAASAGDRFILRSSSGDLTIGGGSVLDAHPTKHRRKRSEAAEQLQELSIAESAGSLLHEVSKKPYGLDLDQACLLLGTTRAALADEMKRAEKEGMRTFAHGNRIFLTTEITRARIAELAAKRLTAYHDEHPLSLRGLNANELAQGMGGKAQEIPAAAIEDALNQAVASNTLNKARGTFTLPGRAVQLSAKDNEALKKLRARIEGPQPAQPADLLPELPVDKKRLTMLTELLVEDGDLVQAPGAVFFSADEIERLRALLQKELAGSEGISVSDFNKLAGTSRKYGIPLLQHFENEGVLVRDGDMRKLAQQETAAQ